MTKSAKYILLSLLIALALLTSACGASAPPTSSAIDTISTAVAMTVEAENAQQTQFTPTPAFTETPLPAFPNAATPTARPKPTNPPPASANDLACMKASLIDQTIPDGTIKKPGEQFTEVWHIRNDSTCVWDTTYKIVFWDGDVMGGGYVYNFPQQALPGDTVAVPLVLTAPAQDGTYRSSWKLQTPGGASFGVGYDSPFWVDIVVSSSDKIDYGVTSVTYEVVRDPAAGCPANVFYTIYATISVNGPITIVYNWAKSDGTTENKKTLKFTEAGSQTVQMQWSLHLGSATNERWARIFTISPTQQDYDKATFLYDCK
ncbi:MAG: NBR1-Ig-like domain-containing protein [Acidithiobacillus sp.]|nr:NBR1-Ig-like domain-containing protein [Acidithiobacillus sp.]